MKNLSFLFKSYIFILFASLFIHSCCTQPDRATIIGAQDINFISVQNGEVNNSGVIGSSRFNMFISLDLEFANHFIENPLINSAYGWSCEIEFLNSVEPTTIEVFCNREIEYNGSTIPAGTDFSNNPDLDISSFGEDVTIVVKDEFMDRSEFTNGFHEFTVNFRTNDGLELVSTGTINIQI